MAGNNQPIQKRNKGAGLPIFISDKAKQKLFSIKEESFGSGLKSKPALQIIPINTEKTPEENILTSELIDLINSKKTTNEFKPQDFFS